MPLSAVLFDLFGTLVPTFSGARFRQCLARMAGAVGVSPEDFSRLWLRDTARDRGTGVYRTAGLPQRGYPLSGLSQARA